jgi:hypothetical protein
MAIIGAVIFAVIVIAYFVLGSASESFDMNYGDHLSVRVVNFCFDADFFKAWSAGFPDQKLSAVGITSIKDLYTTGSYLLQEIDFRNQEMIGKIKMFIQQKSKFYDNKTEGDLMSVYTNIFYPVYKLMRSNITIALNDLINPPNALHKLPSNELPVIKQQKFKPLISESNLLQAIIIIGTLNWNAKTNKIPVDELKYMGDMIHQIIQQLTYNHKCMMIAYDDLLDTMYHDNKVQDVNDAMNTYETEPYNMLINELTMHMNELDKIYPVSAQTRESRPRILPPPCPVIKKHIPLAHKLLGHPIKHIDRVVNHNMVPIKPAYANPIKPAYAVADPIKPAYAVADPIKPAYAVADPIKPAYAVADPIKPAYAVADPIKPAYAVADPIKPAYAVADSVSHQTFIHHPQPAMHQSKMNCTCTSI